VQLYGLDFFETLLKYLKHFQYSFSTKYSQYRIVKEMDTATPFISTEKFETH